MVGVDMYERIRKMRCQEGLSQREVARRLNISRNTVRKYWNGGVIPGEQEPRQRERTVLTAEVVNMVKSYLDSDKDVPGEKQNHTAQRVYDRLAGDEKFTGSYSSIVGLVRTLRRPERTAYVPLVWDMGDAGQVDWGTARAEVGGRMVRCQLFCMRLCYSLMPFVVAFPMQRSEFLAEGHRLAFEFYKGTTRRVIYDNMRTAVKEGWGRYVKQKQAGLLLMEAHYAYNSEFCSPGAAHEKGLIENLVGWVRRNVLVPMPRAKSWGEINEKLLEACMHYQGHRVPGRSGTVGELFAAERLELSPLPDKPLDTSRTSGTRIKDNCLVRFDNCYYSVPSKLVGEPVTVKGYAYEVKVYWGGEEVARHERRFGSNEIEYKLEHYIDLLTKKPRAARQAAPVRQNVASTIQSLRDRLPNGRKGDLEFVQILRLVVDYGQDAVLQAVQAGLARQQYRYEAIRFELLQGLNEAQAVEPALDLDRFGVQVQKPNLRAYDRLLEVTGR